MRRTLLHLPVALYVKTYNRVSQILNLSSSLWRQAFSLNRSAHHAQKFGLKAIQGVCRIISVHGRRRIYFLEVSSNSVRNRRRSQFYTGISSSFWKSHRYIRFKGVPVRQFRNLNGNRNFNLEFFCIKTRQCWPERLQIFIQTGQEDMVGQSRGLQIVAVSIATEMLYTRFSLRHFAKRYLHV